MFDLTDQSKGYRRVGFGLLVMQLALFIYGFPPFHFGIWVQVEPMLLMMFMYGYLSAAWLAAGIAKGWLRPTYSTPLWWAMAAWVGWQLIATLFALSSWRSWFGSPELGEGTAWHVALLLMVMMAYPFMQTGYYQRILFVAAIGFIILMAALHEISPRNELEDMFGFNSERWVSSRFPKDLPFMAAYTGIAMMCCGWLCGRRGLTAYAVFFISILCISNNRSAMATLGVGIGLTLLVHYVQQKGLLRRFLYPGPCWRAIAVGLCLLPFLWVAFCVNLGMVQPYLDRLKNAERQAGPRSEFLLTDKEGAIGSRVPYVQVAVATMKHEPVRWLVGGGWGRFTDDLYQYALVDGVYVYRDGKRDPNWSALQDVTAVHAHNQPLEALLSLGLPGMLLWFAIPMLSIWYLPRRLFWPVAPMLVALVMLSFFWFELVQDMPFRALMLASVCHVSTARCRLRRKKEWLVPLLACACLSMGWSAWEQREAILYSQTLRVALLTQSDKDYPEARLLEDAKRGGDRLRESALMYELSLAHTIKNQPADDIDRGWYRLFLHATHDYAALPGSHPRAASTGLWLIYKLSSELDYPSFTAVKQEWFPRIPEDLLMIAAKAPLRDDVAATYLYNLPQITDHNVSKQMNFLTQLLTLAPGNRGALWAYGNLLHQVSGREAEGKVMMRAAVARGLQTVYPVSNNEIAASK